MADCDKFFFMLLGKINSGMMRLFYLLWCVGLISKERREERHLEKKKKKKYLTHVAKSRFCLMAFRLQMLLVNSSCKDTPQLEDNRVY